MGTRDTLNWFCYRFEILFPFSCCSLSIKCQNEGVAQGKANLPFIQSFCLWAGATEAEKPYEVTVQKVGVVCKRSCCNIPGMFFCKNNKKQERM